MITKKAMRLLAALLVTTTITRTAHQKLIESVDITKNTLAVKIHKKFKKKYLEDNFFVTYEKDINLEELPYDIVLSSFITNVISIIWISGDTYYIDSMDEDLFNSLKMVKDLFKAAYPKTSWNGELIPRKLIPLPDEWRQKNEKKALLFSGGLDSTSSWIQHRDEDLILITAWGQYDNPLDREDLWRERKQHIQSLAHSHGHSAAFLKSNYSEFFNWDVLDALSPEPGSWRTYTIEGIGWAGLTTPIMLKKNCSTLYIASSTCWYYPYFLAANPYVDGSMRFGNFTLSHDQFDFTRGDKCAFISREVKQSGIQKPFIKVCQVTVDESDTNCCHCKKCLTTILGFIATGDNHQEYGFNISAEDAIFEIMELLKGEVHQWFIWNFIDLQTTLRTKKVEDPSIADLLESFLSLDLTKVKKITQPRGNWEDLAKVGPKITIPDNLFPEKMNISLETRERSLEPRPESHSFTELPEEDFHEII